MNLDVAKGLIESFKELDLIWNKIHELTTQMPDAEAKRLRRIVANCVGDMYTEIELEIVKKFPELNRDKQV